MRRAGDRADARGAPALGIVSCATMLALVIFTVQLTTLEPTAGVPTLGASAAHAEGVGSRFKEGGMRIRIVVDGSPLVATLEDNAASRDFAVRLPLELTLKDYNGTEKIAGLASPLSTQGAPEGIDPDVGDITYFAPWGNLALFYRDFGYSRGLVRLGRIEGSVAILEGEGPLAARIERFDEAE